MTHGDLACVGIVLLAAAVALMIWIAANWRDDGVDQ